MAKITKSNEQIHLQADKEHIPFIVLTLYETGTHLLLELLKERNGRGPWFDRLRDQIKDVIRAVATERVTEDQRQALVEAGLRSVDALFDRIEFAD